MTVVDHPEGLRLGQRAVDHLRVRGLAILYSFPDREVRFARQGCGVLLHNYTAPYSFSSLF